MTKILFAISLFLLPNFVLSAQEDAYLRLVDRMEELKKMGADKQIQITKLNDQITIISRSNSKLYRSNKELKKTVEAKTQKIHELEGQMSDLTFEYEKLILETVRLGGLNNEYKSIIEELKIDKGLLMDSLESSKKKIDNLSVLLVEEKLESELLFAKKQALERRIDELVNYKAKAFGVEVYGNFPYAGGFSFLFAKISKGGNLMYGGKVGFALYQERTGFNVNTTYGSRVIPVGGSLKFALDRKNKLGFNYVSVEAPSERPFKWFGQVEALIAIPIGNKSIPTNYNRPGFGAFAGVGLIFDFNENVKPYLISGIRFQELSKKTLDLIEQDILIGFHVGAGVYF